MVIVAIADASLSIQNAQTCTGLTARFYHNPLLYDRPHPLTIRLTPLPPPPEDPIVPPWGGHDPPRSMNEPWRAER